MLVCPVCKQRLIKEEKRYVCVNNHSFDIAKQGYTNLYLKSSRNSGDNKAMVEARTQFLRTGHYAPLCNALIDLLRTLPHDVIVDAGCGEGYYTSHIQETLHPTMYAFDLSKEALKYASRNDKETNYFLNSIFDLPLTDTMCDIVLNIFAPLASEEYARILKDKGYLIKVDPHKDHLLQMKNQLYEHVYENEVFDLNVEGFTLVDHKEVQFRMDLDNEALCALFTMTPYYYKTKQAARETLMKQEKLIVDAHFIIYIYQKEESVEM